MRPRLARAAAVVAAAWSFGPGVAVAQHLDPIRTRNLSPLASIFGVPTWEPVSSQGAPEVGAVTELANHYRLSVNGDELLVLDGETWRSALFVKYPLGERWSASLEVPYYQQSGGVLDDLVDAWHSVFGLPDGGRSNAPEGALQYRYFDRDLVVLQLDDRWRGLGDVQLSLGRTIGASENLSLRATVKLPSGDENMLAGSGAADVAVTLLRTQPLRLPRGPSGAYWGLGVLGLGRAELLGERMRDVVYVGMLGAGWRLFPRIGLKAQLDVHTAFYDSALKELGNTALQVSLGGWWQLAPGRALEFAVNEDLQVSTSPDVVLHVGLRWAL